MNQKRLEYLVLSWNVRGLGRVDKCDIVRNSISSSHPHVCCLQESKLDDLDSNKVRAFLPSPLSSHYMLPADGSRGGVVTAWNPNTLTADQPRTGHYTLTTTFTSTTSLSRFTVTNVYAPADHRLTPAFLAELNSITVDDVVPWLLIGDFNLTRSPSDKNTPSFDSALAARFNTTIDTLALIEIPLVDRLFTWSNKRASPTLARLDRAFVNTAFNAAFPDTLLSSKIGNTSDHIPLHLHIPTTTPKPHCFRFENAWLKDASFLPMATAAWASSTPITQDAAGALVARIKATRQAASVWARKGNSKPTHYCNCSFIVLMLDMFEEICPLSAGEQMLRAQYRDEISAYILQEVARWKQRGKCRALREGDANTRYFHAWATVRRRQNRIQCLEVDGMQLFAHETKVAAVNTHYAAILGREDATSWAFSLADMYSRRPVADAAALAAEFSEAEAAAAVHHMRMDSAPGPDGFGPSFYKVAWPTVKPAIMAFLHGFYRGETDLGRFYRAHIVLIPKCYAAATPSAFRPVSLQNCPVKILTKLLTTRLQAQIQKLVDID